MDEERSETLDCGCRQNKATGAKTKLCDAHETGQSEQMAKISHTLRNARVSPDLPYNPSGERY